jgi:hypothetical protein
VADAADTALTTWPGDWACAAEPAGARHFAVAAARPAGESVRSGRPAEPHHSSCSGCAITRDNVHVHELNARAIECSNRVCAAGYC